MSRLLRATQGEVLQAMKLHYFNVSLMSELSFIF